MKKIILIFISLITLSIFGYGQIVTNVTVTQPTNSTINQTTFDFTYSSDGLQFDPVTNPTSNTDHSSRISPWVEFGDGNFAAGAKIEHIYGPSSSINYPAFVKASGIYTGPVKPPASRMITMPTNVTSIYNPTPTTSNQPTLNNAYLKITPSVWDVSDEDPMHFAISYTLPAQQNSNEVWYLVFVYNKGIAGTSSYVFNKTNPAAAFNVDGGTQGYIRNAGDFSTPITDSWLNNCADIPANSDVLAFPFTNPASQFGKIRNLFITLDPKAGTVYGSTTFVKALLIKRTGLKPNYTYSMPNIGDNSLSSEISLNVRGSQPHDPNYEVVQPTCLELPKKSSDILHYHIHFQNTGPTYATEVIVSTSLPFNTKTDAIKAALSSKPAVYKIANTYLKPGVSTNGLSIDQPSFNQYGDSIIFHFRLAGGSIVLDKFTNFTDVTTMGDIWFDIPLDATVGSTLNSRSSIVFGKNSDYEAPVITNEATSVYKKHCGECDCKPNPCKKRKGLWRWLLCKKC